MKTNETYSTEATFRERMILLRGDMTQKAFAEKVGISRPSVANYESGERLPDAYILKNIAQKCNVSADWLLGLSDIVSPNIEIRRICEKTGLSESFISFMVTDKDYQDSILTTIFNYLVNDLTDFRKLMIQVSNYYDAVIARETEQLLEADHPLFMIRRKLRRQGLGVVTSKENVRYKRASVSEFFERMLDSSVNAMSVSEKINDNLRESDAPIRDYRTSHLTSRIDLYLTAEQKRELHEYEKLRKASYQKILQQRAPLRQRVTEVADGNVGISENIKELVNLYDEEE